jgi:hypothetical protein
MEHQWLCIFWPETARFQSLMTDGDAADTHDSLSSSIEVSLAASTAIAALFSVHTI